MIVVVMRGELAPERKVDEVGDERLLASISGGGAKDQTCRKHVSVGW